MRKLLNLAKFHGSKYETGTIKSFLRSDVRSFTTRRYAGNFQKVSKPAGCLYRIKHDTKCNERVFHSSLIGQSRSLNILSWFGKSSNKDTNDLTTKSSSSSIKDLTENEKLNNKPETVSLNTVFPPSNTDTSVSFENVSLENSTSLKNLDESVSLDNRTLLDQGYQTPSGYSPVDILTKIFFSVHEYFGISYLLTIILITAAVKLLFFPIEVTQIAHKIKSFQHSDKLNSFKNDEKHYLMLGDKTNVKRVNEELETYKTKHNIDPKKIFFISTAYRICMSFTFILSIYNLKKEELPGYLTEYLPHTTSAYVWQCDPTFLFPFLNVLTLLLNSTLNSIFVNPFNSIEGKTLFFASRFLLILFFIIGAYYIPTVIYVFFIINNLYNALAIFTALKSQLVKKHFSLKDFKFKPAFNSYKPSKLGLIESMVLTSMFKTKK